MKVVFIFRRDEIKREPLFCQVKSLQRIVMTRCAGQAGEEQRFSFIYRPASPAAMNRRIKASPAHESTAIRDRVHAVVGRGSRSYILK